MMCRPRAETMPQRKPALQLRANRSNSQTPQALSRKLRVPLTGHPSKHSTPILSKRSGTPPPISSRVGPATIRTTRRTSSKSSSSSKCGLNIRTSSSLISAEMKRQRLTCANGARLGVAWKLRFKDEKNTSMRQLTFRKLVASSAPTGRQRGGTQMTTLPSLSPL